MIEFFIDIILFPIKAIAGIVVWYLVIMSVVLLIEFYRHLRELIDERRNDRSS